MNKGNGLLRGRFKFKDLSVTAVLMRGATLIALLVTIHSSVIPQVTKPTPKVALKNLQGRIVRLSDYKGKVVMLNFWAEWCAPCLAEMPDLIKWQKENKARGLVVLGVTYPPTELPEVHQVLKKLGVNYPILLGDEATKTQFDDGDVLPMTVIIDRKGKIRDIVQGTMDVDEFKAKVVPLL